MALAKVTIEALSQMANILRQNADDILTTKEQMDSELYSIPWDDPIGRNFISRYEEDFKPLKNKLIPNIESYIQYMQNEGVIVSEYSGENAGTMGMAGVGAMGLGIAGAATTANATGMGFASTGSAGQVNSTTGNQGIQTKKKVKEKSLTPVEEMDMEAILAELSPEQKASYDKLKNEILERKEHELFRAKDMENMAKEMRMDNGGKAAAVYAIRAESIKEDAMAKSEEELRKLDELAREAVRIIRNKK